MVESGGGEAVTDAGVEAGAVADEHGDGEACDLRIKHLGLEAVGEAVAEGGELGLPACLAGLDVDVLGVCGGVDALALEVAGVGGVALGKGFDFGAGGDDAVVGNEGCGGRQIDEEAALVGGLAFQDELLAVGGGAACFEDAALEVKGVACLMGDVVGGEVGGHKTKAGSCAGDGGEHGQQEGLLADGGDALVLPDVSGGGEGEKEEKGKTVGAQKGADGYAEDEGEGDVNEWGMCFFHPLFCLAFALRRGENGCLGGGGHGKARAGVRSLHDLTCEQGWMGKGC